MDVHDHEGSSAAGLRYDYVLDPDADTSGARLVRLTGRNKRVLDLGCAAGALDRVLVERGCQVVGWEYDRAAAKIAEAVCERVIVADLDTADLDLELEADRFDVIIAGDVLEHLRDPGALLRRLPEFLRPGGWIALSVPNVAHGSVRLALLHGDFPRSETGLLDDTHRQFLTRDTLTALLTDSGWDLVYLDATRLDPRASEVPFPDDAVTEKVMPDIEADPEASIYQYVALAVPSRPEGPDALPGLVQELWLGQDERVRRLERELAASRTHTQNLAAEVVLAGQARDVAHEETASVRMEILAHNDEMFRKDRQLDWLRKQLEQRQAHDAYLQARIQDLTREAADLELQVGARDTALQGIHGSKLWRSAAVYRGVVNLARRRMAR